MNRLGKTISFIFVFIVLLSLSACSLSNTPSKKVEMFLDKYNKNDTEVISQLDDMLNSDQLMDEVQKNTYRNILEKQYKDMTYVIKDEKIEGDKATVTAEIEVYDFYKVNKEAEEYYNSNQDEFNDNVKETINDNSDNNEKVENEIESAKDKVENGAENVTDSISREVKFINYRLDRLKEVKDRVKYTIDFSLTRVDGKWQIDDIDDITRQKIHGLYEH